MRGVPALVDRGATLLEADPGLGRTVGVRAAAAIGYRLLLPVLSVATGPWTPPRRAALGADTVSLTVLDGLLTDRVTVLGPGDHLQPWDGGCWTACSPVRVAVIGAAYTEALRAWPAAAQRRHEGVGARIPTGGALEDRLLELLWRIALRWGEPAARGVSLPRALGLGALHQILGAAETEVALALAVLSKRGATIRSGANWLLLAGHHEVPRREALLAGAAVQLALARAGRDECLALCEVLELEFARRAGRGARGGPLRAR